LPLAVLFFFFPALFAAVPVAAQDIENAQLLHPPPDSWPLYHGDYSGRRHINLTQISPQNVGDLALARAFQTGQAAQIKSSPLLVDGILYFTVPDNVSAVDARSGHQVWHYNRPSTEGLHIGHRGVAMNKSSLYFTTPDCHLISLDAKDGKVRWDKVICDVSKGYWMTMAPLVVRSHFIVGVSDDFDNLSGYLRSLDPESGATQWQWDATQPAGTPDAATGGMTWMTGTYDPELNLVYWGTGNPTPVLNGSTRPGHNLYTCRIVAIHPDDGKLAWAFQASPHDKHDWDAVETPVLVDRDFHGQPRKLLMQTSRNGYFFVLDPRQRQELVDGSVWPPQLGHWNRQGRPPHSQPSQGAGARWKAHRSRRRRPHQLPLSQF
jgi:alcohol dehydrogenase (cytochrome c)